MHRNKVIRNPNNNPRKSLPWHEVRKTQPIWWWKWPHSPNKKVNNNDDDDDDDDKKTKGKKETDNSILLKETY